MLYVDRTLAIRDFKLPSGAWAHGCILGARSMHGGYQRGQQVAVTTMGMKTSHLAQGLHHDLAVNCHKNLVRLTPCDHPGILTMMLTSRLTSSWRNSQKPPYFHRGTVGTIRVPRRQSPKYLMHINAEQWNGLEMIRWQEAILRAQPGYAYLLTWSDWRGETWQWIVYVVDYGKIIDCALDDFSAACHKYGIELSDLPFSVGYDIARCCSRLDRREWRKI